MGGEPPRDGPRRYPGHRHRPAYDLTGELHLPDLSAARRLRHASVTQWTANMAAERPKAAKLLRHSPKRRRFWRMNSS